MVPHPQVSMDARLGCFESMGWESESPESFRKSFRSELVSTSASLESSRRKGVYDRLREGYMAEVVLPSIDPLPPIELDLALPLLVSAPATYLSGGSSCAS